MSFNLIIVKSSPYSGRESHEILEAIMSLGLFEVEHRVVFFDSGIAWLATEQNPSHQKSLIKHISALPLYGSDALYFVKEHLTTMDDAEISDVANPVSLDHLAKWTRAANHVEVF